MLCGCGGSGLSVDSFDVRDPHACRALVDALPARVAELPEQTVSGSSYAAAWGSEDPIVLRCGVPMPEDFSQTSDCHMADGIGWFATPSGAAEDQSLDVTMTTVHRSPVVSVDVPASRRPPVAAMVDLAGVIKKHTRSTGQCR